MNQIHQLYPDIQVDAQSQNEDVQRRKLDHNAHTAAALVALGMGIAWRIAALLAAAAMVIAPVLTAAAALAVAWFAGAAVYSLFERLGASPVERILAAAASVGMLAAFVGVLVLARSNRLRASALIYALAWLPMVVALVGLESAFRAALLTTNEEAAAMVVVPQAITTAGGVLAALLAGLALIPLVNLAVAARRSDDPDERESLGYYIGNALKLVILTATAGANVAFGLRQNVPLEVTIFVAVVLETAFVLALIRARAGRLHKLALVVFGGAVSLVAVETLSVLSGLVTLPMLAEIGKALYLLTPAAGIAYIVLGALSERDAPATNEARPVLRRLSGRIRHLRDDLADLRAALDGRAAEPALPAHSQRMDETHEEVIGAPSLNGAHPKSR